MDFQKLFLSANGRIGRGEFWIGFVILLVANFIISALSHAVPFIGILGLVLLYCSICVYSKRLHDMGHSGWLQVIPMLVFLVGIVIAIAMGGMAMLSGMAGGANGGGNPSAAMGALGIAGIVFMIGGLVALGFLLWVGLSNGQPGDNKYGPPPAKSAPAAA
jgi:uncharacterized membrane protein YhaH (DUF805 family)